MVQLVLLERIAKLGGIGDIVNVKPGYARNFLLPGKKALRASAENIKKFESERKQLEAKNLESKKEAEKIQSEIQGMILTIIRSASDSGSLYGSVTTRDAEQGLKEKKLIIDRKQIVLEKPIKELGLHTISISLHPEVVATVELNVARSEEEAEIQKTGNAVKDKEAKEEAELEFDISELFDDKSTAEAISKENDDVIEEGDKNTTETAESEPTEKIEVIETKDSKK